MFCKLSQGQIAALMFIKAMQAKAKTGSKIGTKIAMLVANQKWDDLASILSFATPDGATAPTRDDIKSVCVLTPGTQNAHFFLALVDAGSDDGAKAKFQESLDTHCYNDLATTIDSKLVDPDTHFSGDELREAYSPQDNAPCSKPDGSIFSAIGTVITSGKLVGNFFAKSLPDFFQTDFPQFFTGTIPGVFSGPLTGFFKNLGSGVANDFTNFSGKFKDAVETLGGAVDDTAKRAAEAAAEKARQAAQIAADAAEAAKRAAEEAADRARSAAEAAASAAREAAERAKHALNPTNW